MAIHVSQNSHGHRHPLEAAIGTWKVYYARALLALSRRSWTHTPLLRRVRETLSCQWSSTWRKTSTLALSIDKSHKSQFRNSGDSNAHSWIHRHWHLVRVEVRVPPWYYTKYLLYTLHIPLPSQESRRQCSTLSPSPQYITVQYLLRKQNTTFQDLSCSSSGRIPLRFSFSESLLLESQEFMMHEDTRMTTIPEAATTKAKTTADVFWKQKSNRAIKNTNTLNKLVIVTIGERGNRDAMTHDHISRAYVRLNMTARGSR